MAKRILTDFDFGNIGQLLGARLHNVTTAERSTLAGTLTGDNVGVAVYDTDESLPYVWDGTAFVGLAPEIAGDVIFRGVLDVVDYDQNDPGYSTGPEFRESGSEYVIGEAGTLDIDGVTTYTPSAEVEAGDRILFTASDAVSVFQRNDEQATETILGNIRLASQTEVNTGTEATKAVTPATLQGKLDSEQYVKGYFTTVSTTAATAETINHGLNLSDKDAFTINVMDSSGSQVAVDVDSVDADNLTITTLLAHTDLKVTVSGFSATP